MTPKKSRFNFLYRRGENETVLYNTFSKALVVLDDIELSRYETLTFADNDVEKQMVENGILVDETYDELGFLKYWHYKTKFATDTLFLTIAPTMDCNFACPYCYENRRPGRMSQEVQDALVRFVQERLDAGAELLDISWYGGEPLLCIDIVEHLSRRFQSLAQTKGCTLKMHMVTNGYLLTPETVALLDELGITRIQITLDGCQEHHDVRRPLRGGQGTFEQIFSNLQLFADSPIEVLVRMNVDNENYKDYRILKQRIEALGNPNISLYPSPVEDLNPDKVNKISAFMTTDEFDAFTLKTCDEEGVTPEDFSVMDDRYCFCTAETENCYVVDETGDVFKCWDEVGRREYRCFNLLDPEGKNYSIIAHYLTADPFADEKCKGCVFLPLCFGGCKFQRAHLEKSVCGFTDETLKKYIESAFF